jgi:hypothetical protein
MRFARGDVRDHIVSRKTTTDLHIRAKEGCSRRDSSESIFARFSASFDFRLLQQGRKADSEKGPVAGTHKTTLLSHQTSFSACLPGMFEAGRS